MSLSPSPDEKRKQPRPPVPYYYDEAEPPTPRYFLPNNDPPGVTRAESLPTEIGFEPSRRKRSHKASSKPLNRVNSLLDDNSTVESRSSLRRPPPRSERPPPPRSRTDPIPVHRSPSQWSNDWSFVDEYGNRSEASTNEEDGMGCEWTKPENFACGEVIPGGAGNLFHRPCSSPHCKICEQRRERGLKDEEYNWLKLLLPPSPEKIPTFDPDRPCLCSDTVEL